MLVSPFNAETDHAGQPKHRHSKASSARALEQRKAGWREAAAPAQARLVNSEQIVARERGAPYLGIEVDDALAIAEQVEV